MSRLLALAPAGRRSPLSPRAVVAGLAAGALALVVVAAGPLAPASAVDATVNNESELAAALAAGTTGTNRITLGASITAGGQAVAPVLGFTILDLAGHDLTVTGTSGHAGIRVPHNASLIIQGSGHLIAQGGDNAAGIGASEDGSVGTVNVSDSASTVTATGGTGGAGIGSANGGAGGTVRIASGDVTAVGGMYAAGIGGANNSSFQSSGSAGSVEIDSGTVTATGGSAGAGIGGGIGGNAPNDGTVTIKGGTVHATGGSEGAGIGGGGWNDAGTVKISGGDVTAQGTGGGAGVGSGYNRSGGSVSITGGTVHANGGSSGGAGIGGAQQNPPPGLPITIDAGNVTAVGGANAAGIGGGANNGSGAGYAPSGDITIGANATVTASSPSHTAIGTAPPGVGPYTLKNAGKLTIPADNILQLPSGSTMTNTGTVTNQGEIANSGRITNSATLDGAGTITNDGVMLNTDTIDPGLTIAGAHPSPVSFDLNYSGAATVPLQVYAAKLGDDPVPDDIWAATRTGYTLDGWYDDPTAGTAWTQDTPITATTTLHAHWTLDQETVTFDVAGGSSVDPQTVDYGTTATKPTDPTRDGYTFDGWYTDADGGTTWDFTTAITADTTIHAHWTINHEAVTFDVAGGSSVDPQTVDYGTPATKPTDPTRDGYTFDGWYTDADGGTTWDFGTAITVDTTIHAHWTVIEVAPTGGATTATETSAAPNSPDTAGPAATTAPAPDGGGLVRTGAELGWPLWAAITLLGAGLAAMAWIVRRGSTAGRHR